MFSPCSCLTSATISRPAIWNMGLSGAIIDSLFLAPELFRQGGATLPINHARRLKGPLSVDVNEQNRPALAFYLLRGFSVVSRSPVDADGRPFPLLHLSEPQL
jgi:putative acetyltransferase